jgi:hypothetical protein
MKPSNAHVMKYVEIDHLGDTGEDGRIILRRILRK